MRIASITLYLQNILVAGMDTGSPDARLVLAEAGIGEWHFKESEIFLLICRQFSGHPRDNGAPVTNAGINWTSFRLIIKF
jgi:hypothetical protein